MSTRQPVNGQAMGLMLLLCMIWGFQQVTLKATAADITPMMQIALRSGVAAGLVALLMRRQGEALDLAGPDWRAGLAVGVLFALEFLLVGQGLRHTSASHMVVFLYTAPIFAALGLHLRLPAERLHALQWAGIALAFAGIVWAFFGRGVGGRASAGGPSQALLGDLLGLAAGAAWGATTVVVRTTGLSNASASKTLLYQLLGAFVLLVPAAVVAGQASIRFTPMVWASLAFHAVVVSFASFLVWFWLLRRYLASQLGVFSFLTPLFGVAFGVMLLDEPLEANFVGGAVLVLQGLVLVSGHAWLREAWRRRSA